VDGALRAGAVEIAVSDEGRGVPPAERDRIFEPFFRGAAARGSAGTGLGLAIVREIARVHGGDVELDPSASVGARFVVRLPVAASAKDRAVPDALPAAIRL
jgi:two-component system OmpR family sensor kinase